MSTPVAIVSSSGRPLMPTGRFGRVRHLLKSSQARIISHDPFAIQLLYETPEVVPNPLIGGIDPGSQHCPLALVQPDPHDPTQARVILAQEILLRQDIHHQMTHRKATRRRRRARKTRYRPPRFHNRVQSWCSACGKNHPPKVWKKVKRQHGQSAKWVSHGRAALCRVCQHQSPRPLGAHTTPVILPPTLTNKVDTLARIIQRWSAIFPIARWRLELTAFDTQKMANPAIQGIEYQHGTLAGYEIKEYLLHRDHHRCVYCHGKSGDPILEVEHTISKAHGGTDRVSNLVIACHTCNHEKGPRNADQFGFPAIHKKAATFRAFRYSALTQSYKWALWQTLQTLGIPVEATFGYVTKYWRHQHKLPKAQVVDALVIAAGERTWDAPETVTRIRRLKARRPFHHFSHANTPGQPTVITKARRTIAGFALYDQVRVLIGPLAGTIAYISSLRERQSFQLSTLDGAILGSVVAHRLARLAPVWRNRWIESWSFTQALLKEFHPTPTALDLIKQALKQT